MKFRTEIEAPAKDTLPIARNSRIVMLGSCFTDNIGTRLACDGFDVVHNPMGPLYNPASIEAVVTRAMQRSTFTKDDLERDDSGIWHCLQFASRYQANTADALLAMVNSDFSALSSALADADTVIVTLGTAYVFTRTDGGKVVGNCHKFPASAFIRSRFDIDTAAICVSRIIAALPGKRVIFTVSPVRHTADTLHGNQLSKATLLLAVDKAGAEYFPTYEIVMDDLRDYRFYGADLKHPSDQAVEYIYEQFCLRYFTPETMGKAHASRKETLRKAHRPIFME